jgi:phosphoribosylformylglycinamidine (FGAM) synthase PurS component
MKLMSLLFENEDQDQNSKGLRRTKDIVLSTKNTPVEQVEDALMDLSNYGQYIPYQQKVNPGIKSKTAKILGPSGGPNMKTPANEREWDSSSRDWRLAKAKDIQDRTGMDVEGWEDLRFRQLPKEARNPNVFYPPTTAENVIKAILKVSPKSDILRWENQDDILIFPRKINPVVPNDETLEKIIETVMDNAGIKDYVIKKEEINLEAPRKEAIKIDPIDLPPVEDYQADLLGFEIEDMITKGGLNYSHLKVSPLKSKQTNKVILSISGFRNKKEREKTETAINKMKSELLENRLKFEFQRRAGIIK